MKWVRRILVTVLILAAALSVFGFFLVRRSFPRIDGNLTVDGLDAPVEVIRDVDGVPHVYARSEHDLFYAQGYIHAQDRFWQMDFWRHVGGGRLSEMFGDGQVETDMFLRSLDFVGIAEQELAEVDAGHKAILDAYAEGVNAYISGRSPSQISLEYAILPLQTAGYRIEPWTTVNTLTWAKVMSWDLSWNLVQEVDRATLSAGLPLDRIEQLYPAYPEENPVIVTADQTASVPGPVVALPEGAVAAVAEAGRRARVVWDQTGGGIRGLGSNNWVIGGTRTESGLPILANDPHLAIQMPSIWYQIGLHCVERGPDCPYQVAGFGFAGVPGVITGHNDRIAWGVTNQSIDTQDLFVEKLNPDDHTQYEYQGEWIDLQSRTETITVAGGEDVTFDVLVSRHGPLITDTYFEEAPFVGSSLELPAEYAVALAWESLRPSTLLEAVVGLNRATGYEDFRAALSKWDIAAQNVVYADVEGNIAYQSTGRVPIRTGSDGTWPVPGWTGEHEWVGTIPFEDMPRLLNPPRDYIATANQPVLDPLSQPFLSADWDLGYRAARIEEMIEALPTGFTVAAAQTMQMDAFDGGAPNLVPHLLSLTPETKALTAMKSVLRPWSEGATGFQAGPASPRGGGVSSGLGQPSSIDLPRRVARVVLARGRQPVLRGRCRPPRRAGRSLVGRRVDRSGRNPRRHPDQCHDRRPHRARRSIGRRSHRLGVGRPPHRVVREPDARTVGHRPGRVALQPEGAGGARWRRRHRERRRVLPAGRLRSRLDTIDADGDRPLRLRRVHLGEQHRSIGSRLSLPLRRHGRPVVYRRAASDAVGTGTGGAGGRRNHASGPIVLTD